jgi:hypothetical protein
MGITRTQMYQQLVKKPSGSERPGYRGDDAYGGGTTAGGQRDGGERGDGPARGPGPNTRRERGITQQYQGPKGTTGDIRGRDADPKPPTKPTGGDKPKPKTETKPKDKKLSFLDFSLFNKVVAPILGKVKKAADMKTINDYIGSLEDDEKVTALEGLAAQGIGTDNPMGISRNIDRGTLDNPFGTRFGRDNQFITDTKLTSPDIKKSLGEGYQDYLDNLRSRLDGSGDGSDRQPAAPMIPMLTSPALKTVDQEPELSELQRLIAERGTPYRFMADGGIMNADVVGGEFDFESARQMYGLGKLVKKATRAVKKIVKSPVGKAALAYGLTFGIPGVKGDGFFSKGLSGLFSSGVKNKSIMDMLGGKVGVGILGASALAGLTTPDEDEDQLTEEELRGPGLDIASIRANPYATKGQAYAFYADGGDVEKEPVAKKVMPLLDIDGKEKDYRETGGFVDIGRMERADDVPARLSKNEFVFTADAVRNAGDGNIDKGAEVMYNMMKNLENGGDVSEESQGLEGARNMFQTSQRLEEVL